MNTCYSVRIQYARIRAITRVYVRLTTALCIRVKDHVYVLRVYALQCFYTKFVYVSDGLYTKFVYVHFGFYTKFVYVRDGFYTKFVYVHLGFTKFVSL